ncbi:MAG: arginine decarboxylase, partial [Oscillospiraceae bacterium]
SRKNLALHGTEIYNRVLNFADYARSEINKIGGYYAFDKDLINGDDIFDFDMAKLSIHTRDIGLAGIEVYDILRDDYDIQIEFGDIGNILAIISVGDTNLMIERLISALSEIERIHKKPTTGMFDHEYISPIVEMTPKDAFYSEKKSLPIMESAGMICSEFVMCYPPGIPILAPGEKITPDILAYISYAKEKGCFMTGTEDINIEYINVCLYNK